MNGGVGSGWANTRSKTRRKPNCPAITNSQVLLSLRKYVEQKTEELINLLIVTRK